MTEIERLVKEIDKDMQEISKSKPQKLEIPSNFQILLSGVSDNIGVNTIFSDKIDSAIGKIFDGILQGRFDAATHSTGLLDDFLSKAGITQSSFEGELSKRILGTISDSINSQKFIRTKSAIRKCLVVLKDLKEDYKKEHDPIKRKKLEDATHAIKQILKVCSRVYKTRKLITQRVKNGLNTLVNENEEK